MIRPLVYLRGDKDKTANYRRAFLSANFHIADDYKRADALCLCGGGDISPCAYGHINFHSQNIDAERDQREFFLLKRFLDDKRPVIAICRGLQIVNVYFGGTLKQHVRSHKANIGDCYHTVEFFGKAKRFFGKTAVVNSAHHQCVYCVGEGLEVVARSLDGEIEGLFYDNLWAFQFHPERLKTVYADGAVIFDSFYKDNFY